MKKIAVCLVVMAALAGGSLRAEDAADKNIEAKLASDPQPTVGTHIPEGIIEASEEGSDSLAKGIGIKKRSFWDGIQVGAGAGLLGGLNVGLGYRIPYDPSGFWKNRFGFRLDYNDIGPFEKSITNAIDDIKIDDNKVDIGLSGTQFGALIDFYPFSYTWFLGGFRISGGYYTGDFEISGAMPKSASETFSIKDSAGNSLWYKANGTVDLIASLKQDVKGPYAGLGFDMGLFWGLKLYFDAGVVFTEKPKIDADAILNGATITVCGTSEALCSGAGSGTIDVTAVANGSADWQKLKDDTIREYQEELDEISKGYFPMVKLGLLYRF
jgi:hypothetical protein